MFLFVYEHVCNVFGRNIITYNDDLSTTHSDVIAMFDTVIDALKEGQPI